MNKFESTLFIIFLIFFSSLGPTYQIDPALAKDELIKKDEVLLKKIHDKLRVKKEKLEEFEKVELEMCNNNRQLCRERYNYEECYKSKDRIYQETTVEIKEYDDSKVQLDQLSCDDIKEAYEKNKKIIDDNLQKTREIVDSIKQMIVTQKKNIVSPFEQSSGNSNQFMTFLQTNAKVQKNQSQRLKPKPTPETVKPKKAKINTINIDLQKDNSTLYNQFIDEMGTMSHTYSSSFLEIAPIITRSDKSKKESFSLAQIKAKIVSIRDTVERMNYMQDVIKTFIKILREYENGQVELEIAYKKNMDKCINRNNQKNGNTFISLSMDDYEDAKKQADDDDAELTDKKQAICNLKRNASELCENIYGFCLKHHEEILIQINQINDLLLYFEKV